MSEEKKDGLHRAVAKARMQATESIQPYTFPVKAPEIHPKVVPAGRSAPVLAADAAADYAYIQTMVAGVGFPGFPYLSQLATRGEFLNLANALSTEITREWIEIYSESDVDQIQRTDKIKQIQAEFERMNVRDVIRTAAMQDCFFGRAQIFLDIDRAKRSAPLIIDPRTVRQGSFNGVRTVEAIWTTPSVYNALDPIAPDFYRPSKWFMLGQEVHASRLMTIITRPVPDILKPAYNFAGLSLSQIAEPYVDIWLRTRQSVADLINNFSITGLATAMDQVLQGDDDGTNIFARADLFTLTRSNRGLMLLDKEREELVQVNTPLTGLHELQAQSQEHMCSISRLPAIILTGISPSGLNASSDGEIRIFYDWISAQQESFWRHPIQTIMDLTQMSLFGEIDPDIKFKFVPLYQMTAKEEAEIRLADAQADGAYFDRGIVSGEEVREKVAADPVSGYSGIDSEIMPINPVAEPAPGEVDPLLDDEPTDPAAADKSVSEKQHRAMEAAAHGNSTIGIPQSVGEEFISKDDAGVLKRILRALIGGN